MKADKNNELVFEDRFEKEMNNLLERYYIEQIKFNVKQGIAYKKIKIMRGRLAM